MVIFFDPFLRLKWRQTDTHKAIYCMSSHSLERINLQNYACVAIYDIFANSGKNANFVISRNHDACASFGTKSKISHTTRPNLDQIELPILRIRSELNNEGNFIFCILHHFYPFCYAKMGQKSSKSLKLREIIDFTGQFWFAKIGHSSCSCVILWQITYVICWPKYYVFWYKTVTLKAVSPSSAATLSRRLRPIDDAVYAALVVYVAFLTSNWSQFGSKLSQIWYPFLTFRWQNGVLIGHVSRQSDQNWVVW